MSVPADQPNPPQSFTIDDRDRSADARDRTSEAHDRASEARDDRSDERDARAANRDHKDGQVDVEAAADRDGAKQDRKGSAGDRQRSGDDREAASSDRVRSAVERANLVLDGLTGAHQRAHGFAELEREVVKARRTGEPLVLAFIDVDGLKAINDARGHAAGDDVLRQVVAEVKKVVREYDLIVRYGGDEFVCGMLDLNLEDAENRFGGMRKDLAGNGATFSVGLAELADNDTLQALIARADRAMYERRRRKG